MKNLPVSVLVRRNLRNITSSKKHNINGRPDAAFLLYLICYLSWWKGEDFWQQFEGKGTIHDYICPEEEEAMFADVFSEDVLSQPFQCILLDDDLIELIKNDCGLVAEAILECVRISFHLRDIFDDISPELTSFCAYILNKYECKKIRMPYAGMCSIAVQPEMKDCRIDGTEPDYRLLVLACMRLRMHGIDKSHVFWHDAIGEYSLEESEEYSNDAMFAAPSFCRVSNRDTSDDSMSSIMDINYSTIDAEVVRAYLKTHDLRKGVFVTRQNSQIATNKVLLQEWIESKALKSVISLPQCRFMRSSGKAMIWVFDKDYQGDDIEFVALDSCITGDRVFSNFDVDAAKKVIEGSVTRYITRVSYEQVIKSDYNVHPGTYIIDNFIPKREGYKKYRLKDLISLVPVDKFKVTREMQPRKIIQGVVGLQDLSLVFDYNHKGVSATTSARFGIGEVTQDCYLIGLSGGCILSGYVKKQCNEEKIFISRQLIALMPNQIVDGDYLMREMSEQYVKEQLYFLNFNGAIAPSYSNYVEQLLQLRILLPSKTKQELRTKEEWRERYAHLIDELDSASLKFRQDMHRARHAMGQTIGAMNNWWSLFEQFSNINPTLFESIDKLEGCDKSLQDVIRNLKHHLKRLSTQVDRFDRGFKYSPQRMALLPAIQEYVSTHQTPVFRYEIECQDAYVENSDEEKKFYFDYSDEDDVTKQEVMFSKEVLYMILNNIMSNASSHGFQNNRNRDNVVRIRCWAQATSIVVSIANNGAPCAPDMTEEQIIAYGESSNLEEHCGIGGYEVKFLMNNFGQELEIHLNADKEFPVEYRLIFKALDNE